MLLLLAIFGCAEEPATWYYGEDLSQLSIVPVDWDMGVYPNTSVLDDPENPFAEGVDAEMKWTLLSTDCVPGFYAFATTLANEPTGEHQFYTSKCLQTVYDAGRLAPEDTYWGWSAAIRGYQAVLDNFPDDVTYDATGTLATPVAPWAYEAIVAMGGTPEGDAP